MYHTPIKPLRTYIVGKQAWHTVESIECTYFLFQTCACMSSFAGSFRDDMKGVGCSDNFVLSCMTSTSALYLWCPFAKCNLWGLQKLFPSYLRAAAQGVRRRRGKQKSNSRAQPPLTMIMYYSVLTD